MVSLQPAHAEDYNAGEPAAGVSRSARRRGAGGALG